MKKFFKILAISLFIVIAFWSLLTFWVEIAGKQQLIETKAESTNKRVLIIYNPDPIYNLDEQVALAFARGLKTNCISSIIATNKRLDGINKDSFDYFVFIANTYNFRPDIGTKKAIESLGKWKSQQAIAITLGAGSTDVSQNLFQQFIQAQGINIIDARTYWVLRPNDDNKLKESNTEVALELVKNWVDVIVATW